MPPVLWCIILFTLFGACVEEIQLRGEGTLQFSFSSQSVSLLFQYFCHMFQTSLRNDSESRALRSLKLEPTSVADISCFLSKWKGQAGWDGASTLSTAYTRHFRVGCHACVKGFFPCAVVLHCVSTCVEQLPLSFTSNVMSPCSVKEETSVKTHI